MKSKKTKESADATWVELPGEWITECLAPTITALKGLMPTDAAKHSSWANMIVLHPQLGYAAVSTPVAGVRMTMPVLLDAPAFAIPYGTILALRREDWSKPLRVKVPNDVARGRLLLDVSERTTISLPMRSVEGLSAAVSPPSMLFPEDDIPAILYRTHRECAFVLDTEVAKRNAQYRPLLSGFLLAGRHLLVTDSRIAVLWDVGGNPNRPAVYIPSAFAKLVATWPPEQVRTYFGQNLVWATVQYAEGAYRAYFWQSMPAIEGNVQKLICSTLRSVLAVAGAPTSETWPLPTEPFFDALSEIGGFATDDIVLRLQPAMSPELFAGEDMGAQARATLAMPSVPDWESRTFAYDAKILGRITRHPTSTLRVLREMGTLLVAVKSETDAQSSFTYVLAAAVEK